MASAIHTPKHHKKSTIEHNQEDPIKFHYHFLYKAAIVLIFFVILPLFPSQAPQFINQSLVTRNWELLHLLFVGVAISYGLFSRRNNEAEKENNNNSKFDTAQSLVSRVLHVSSFFEDDEVENENPSETEETKVQTWSNQHQHYWNRPVVIVAPQAQHRSHNFDTLGGEKPLLLPVRSLKSRLSDEGSVAVDDDESCTTTTSFSLNRSTTTSKTSSKRFSSNLNKGSRNVELEGHGDAIVEDKMKENVVLPSPIPWRSRSGRMEPKQEEVESSKPSMEESLSMKSKTSRSRSSSLSPSPESLAKNGEDLSRKKGFYKSCPPPPPPPPPMMFQKSISMKPRYGSLNSEEASFNKELKRSFTTSERNNVKLGMEVKAKGHAENMSNMGEKSDEEQERSIQELMGHASVALGEEEKESFLDKVLVESDDDDEDSESGDEDVGGGRIFENNESEESSIRVGEENSRIDGPCFGTIGDEGPDVDKKADEFIAKFREQIRLQRIDSIKRSTRNTRNSSR
ncbi:uncharacterized protein LOC113850390 [Abrus precatorius]|uniref:Uncharacterized protein LOC113850390 n=1 Tax=Abrus precatorius TaxID=3816 RepID=A0A8B8K159_ABRPR|nr:uncharacterized protein LOC113850390 [Abrus precatorius]